MTSMLAPLQAANPIFDINGSVDGSNIDLILAKLQSQVAKYLK